MLKRLRRLPERARDSLFYLPMLGIVLAVLLAVATSWADTSFGGVIDAVPVLLQTTVDSARSILTTSAAATITVASIVISITVVAVQLASSQFSPRVVPTVFGTRFQQTVIAIVIGTFTYCLLILSRIRVDLASQVTTRRSLSVTLALAFAIVSVLAIVSFIDRSIRVMQVGEIIRRTTEETLQRISIVLPARGTAPLVIEDERGMPDGPPATIRSRDDGWVLAIDTSAILGALSDGGAARLDTTVGGFVAVGSPLVTVWTTEIDAEGPDETLIHSAFEIGQQRRARSDATFGVRQLVDVALRALSPGVNDPTTANEVILNLTTILREVLVSDTSPRVLHGEEGRRLFRPMEWTRADWVRHAFAEIRVASTTQPAVNRTLIEALGALALHFETQDLGARIEPLRAEAALVLEGLEHEPGLLAADVEPVRLLAETRRLVEKRTHPPLEPETDASPT